MIRKYNICLQIINQLFIYKTNGITEYNNNIILTKKWNNTSLYWLLFYQSPKELPSSQSPHGPHLPRDLTPVTQTIFLMNATELMRMILSTMFLRDTELKRETQSALELVFGNFQRLQDLNGQRISFEDST